MDTTQLREAINAKKLIAKLRPLTPFEQQTLADLEAEWASRGFEPIPEPIISTPEPLSQAELSSWDRRLREQGK